MGLTRWPFDREKSIGLSHPRKQRHVRSSILRSLNIAETSSTMSHLMKSLAGYPGETISQRSISCRYEGLSHSAGTAVYRPAPPIRLPVRPRPRPPLRSVRFAVNLIPRQLRPVLERKSRSLPCGPGEARVQEPVVAAVQCVIQHTASPP